MCNNNWSLRYDLNSSRLLFRQNRYKLKWNGATDMQKNWQNHDNLRIKIELKFAWKLTFANETRTIVVANHFFHIWWRLLCTILCICHGRQSKQSQRYQRYGRSHFSIFTSGKVKWKSKLICDYSLSTVKRNRILNEKCITYDSNGGSLVWRFDDVFRCNVKNKLNRFADRSSKFKWIQIRFGTFSVRQREIACHCAPSHIHSRLLCTM